jgi:hypothetical protein
MKQAQSLQANFEKAKQELGAIEVVGESGGGLVKIVMTCNHDVRSVTLDPEVLKEDKAMVEDLVAAAFNDAARRAEEKSREKLSGMTAGLNIPGMGF